MPDMPDYAALDEFLGEIEAHIPLSVFFPLAAEHGLLPPTAWQAWAAARLAEAPFAERWLTNLRSATAVPEVRDALAERTESVPVSGYWGYYDLLEVGMRGLLERFGQLTFAEVLEESTTALQHKPVRLDEGQVCAALSHAEGAESHPEAFNQARIVCQRLANHAGRLFELLGLPLEAPAR